MLCYGLKTIKDVAIKRKTMNFNARSVKESHLMMETPNKLQIDTERVNIPNMRTIDTGAHTETTSVTVLRENPRKLLPPF